MAILGTLLVHAIFCFLLVLFEISKPPVKNDDLVSVELAPDISDEIPLPDLTNQQSQATDDSKELKNIESNAGEANKSFNDYYREVEDQVNNGKSKETFKANDYANQRWLAKDYSKDQGFIIDNELQKKQDNSSPDKSSSKNTYAGNTIITYNLGGRKATRLPIPAYQCLGSGEVNIEIVVNQKGYVSSVTVLSANTTLNESCLSEAAQKAALSSRFAIDIKAPASQKGTINYKFVQQ